MDHFKGTVAASSSSWIISSAYTDTACWCFFLKDKYQLMIQFNLQISVETKLDTGPD